MLKVYVLNMGPSGMAVVVAKSKEDGFRFISEKSMDSMGTLTPNDLEEIEMVEGAFMESLGIRSYE